ncbi:MAG TPA: hypothetical protein VIX41_01245 [Acidimicrobiales bacterium]
MSFESLPRSEDVGAWVAAVLAQIDRTPRDSFWRHKALGTTRADVIAEVPRDTRIDIRIPIGEWRYLRRVAEARGLNLRTYLRRAVGTIVVACDGATVDDVPSLLKGGPILP